VWPKIYGLDVWRECKCLNCLTLILLLLLFFFFLLFFVTSVGGILKQKIDFRLSLAGRTQIALIVYVGLSLRQPLLPWLRFFCWFIELNFDKFDEVDSLMSYLIFAIFLLFFKPQFCAPSAPSCVGERCIKVYNGTCNSNRAQQMARKFHTQCIFTAIDHSEIYLRVHTHSEIHSEIYPVFSRRRQTTISYGSILCDHKSIDRLSNKQISKR